MLHGGYSTIGSQFSLELFKEGSNIEGNKKLT